MQVPQNSPLWKARRPSNGDERWLDSFDLETLTHEQRDALIDLMWEADNDASTWTAIKSREIQAACHLLAGLLGGPHHDLAVETLTIAFRLRFSEPKSIAIAALANEPRCRDLIVDVALSDASWMVRRAAWQAVAGVVRFPVKDDVRSLTTSATKMDVRGLTTSATTKHCGDLFRGADDPHWRVRFAIVEAASAWATEMSWDNVIGLAERTWQQHGIVASPHARWRVEGVWRHMHYLAGRDTVPNVAIGVVDMPEPMPLPTWAMNDDAHVVALHLRRRASEDDAELDNVAARLLGRDSPDVATEARRRLERSGHVAALVAALDWLVDPRHPGHANTLDLLKRLDGDRLESMALANIESCDKRGSEPRQESRQNARAESLGDFRYTLDLAIDPARTLDASAASLENDADIEQLQRDHNPRVRAAAMTKQRATELMNDPLAETSWSVLEAAATLTNTMLPNRASHEKESEPTAKPTLQLAFGTPPNSRVVIPGQSPVAPLGLSGHYHLPEVGFRVAVEAGVQLMFFEPNYATMTRFFRSLSSSDRHRIQLVAGTFEADPRKIKKDIDRVLRLLGRETIDLFLMFWVRDWSRLHDDAISALESAQATGAIRNYSLSTHSLTLAEEALRRGWAPIMVRHNAAHRRVEEHVLPLAREVDTPVIAFNNTCYGRLLGKRSDDTIDPTAEDCYRFSLSQPGVSACWTAPATMEQLHANLRVLETLTLEEERRSELLARGTRIRASDHAVVGNFRTME